MSWKFGLQILAVVISLQHASLAWMIIHGTRKWRTHGAKENYFWLFNNHSFLKVCKF